jgi:hypothetical protein
MWIFLNNAFLSIVKPGMHDKVDSTLYLKVRARFAEDIKRVFPKVCVRCTPETDYRYRAFVKRTDVADKIAASITAIDYPNFKDTVLDDDRHDAYLKVWTTMWQAQHWRRHQPRHKPPKHSGYRARAIYSETKSK